MNLNTLRLHGYQSGLAARFATCPPPFGFLLDLRKTHSQPALIEAVLQRRFKTYFPATGMVCLLQRSQGGARSAGDMSGSRYAVAVAS